jgi:hypothetical protein
MRVFSLSGSFIGLSLIAIVVASGCSAESGAEQTSAEETTSQSAALLHRCTVRGEPPVTIGCDAGESCRVIACTESIPPSCWGTCQAKPTISKCTGAFNCLCGTPVCVDGEWTCQGSCGGDPVEE